MKRALLPSVALLAVLVGCNAPSDVMTVSGSVSWNDAPLKEGDIVLLPADGRGTLAAGKIHDGEFELQARPGPKRVEIRAVRDGKFNPVMHTTAKVPYIPARYNTRSELKAMVTQQGDNHFDFELRGEKK